MLSWQKQTRIIRKYTQYTLFLYATTTTAATTTATKEKEES
jgi:hypothetical protein